MSLSEFELLFRLELSSGWDCRLCFFAVSVGVPVIRVIGFFSLCSEYLGLLS